MNSAFLNSVFDFQDLLAGADPLPRLSPSARAPRRRDALAIACVHRMIHLRSPYYVDRIAHYEPDRLIWLRDIDLLMRSMDQADLAAFATEAADRGIVLTCHDAAVRARAALGTPMPEPLDQLAATTKDEKVDRFLNAGETVRTIMDIGAKKGMRAKARHLGELLFPSRRFMRDRFRGSNWPLGLLYVRRAFGGILERLSGQQHRRR